MIWDSMLWVSYAWIFRNFQIHQVDNSQCPMRWFNLIKFEIWPLGLINFEVKVGFCTFLSLVLRATNLSHASFHIFVLKTCTSTWFKARSRYLIPMYRYKNVIWPSTLYKAQPTKDIINSIGRCQKFIPFLSWFFFWLLCTLHVSNYGFAHGNMKEHGFR